MRRRWVLCCLLVSAANLPACHAGPAVTRIASGRDASGRWIHPDVYAAYLEGAMAEARGDERRAAAAYASAIEEDAGAAEAWARLGSVLCLTAKNAADRAIARAKSLADDLEDPWLAAAECDLRRGNGKSAVENARRALARGPNDGEASRVLGSALERTGDAVGARRILRALALRSASAPLGTGSVAPSGNSRGHPPAPAAVAHALEQRDVTAARAAALQEHLPTADVAFLALSMGRPDLALQIAELQLMSDPGDSSARVLALVGADLARDEERLGHFGLPLPPDRTRPSPRAAALMAELLSRRAGPEAARTWANACRETEPRDAAVPR